VTDAYINVRAAYTWLGGTISRIDLPILDAASATPASPVLAIQAPQLTQASAPGPLPGSPITQPRPWLQQNFRLTSTAPVAESLTRTMRVGAVSLGPGIQGGTVDITMGFGPERPDLLSPFQTALQRGGQLMAQPTDVTLHLLTSNFKTDLATVTLHACRVTGMNIIPPPAGSRAVPKTIVTVAFADASIVITPV